MDYLRHKCEHGARIEEKIKAEAEIDEYEEGLERKGQVCPLLAHEYVAGLVAKASWTGTGTWPGA